MTEPKGTHQAREQQDLAVLSINESVGHLQVSCINDYVLCTIISQSLHSCIRLFMKTNK